MSVVESLIPEKNLVGDEAACAPFECGVTVRRVTIVQRKLSTLPPVSKCATPRQPLTSVSRSFNETGWVHDKSQELV
jgi:hypothetical protein